MSDYDVCVIGLGPTGLTLAHLLAERGVTVLVLEREPEFYGMARAVYTDDECMRILQTAGVADEVHADMTVDLPVQWVKPDGSVLAQFRTCAQPHGWPVSNFLYQPDFEATLERRLASRPEVTLRRGRAVVRFEQDADGVNVMHQACRGTGYGAHEPDLEPGTEQIDRVQYLVAADGGRSATRIALGIEMDGKSFPQRWLVIDLKAQPGTDPFGHLPYFDFVCDPQLPTVSCPQPDGRHRFEFMLADSDSSEQFELRETAERLLSRYVDVSAVTIERQLVYSFNALVAQRWRDGRVFLAGDAAHMTPQFIGQGMNAGIRDADNLSWKLADVIRHGADPAILDSYQSERRPHASAMIRVSVLNKDIVSTESPWAVRTRDLVIGVSRRLPVLRTALTEAKIKPRPRLRHGQYVGLPRRLRGLRGVEGTLMPQPPVRTRAGRPVRLDDVLGSGWAVIGIGVDPRTTGDWSGLSPRWVTLFEPGARPQGLRGSAADPDVQDVEAIDDQWSRWLRKAGARTGSVIVVRPDRFVFSVTRPGEHWRAQQALAQRSGVPA
ncbi:MAG: bifunctional 3-(3-hydroxy-phenyl)propionate/3-hydroxycinnamic acid hydroxylase [Candidatus Nanopelagicales bacterium]